MKHKILKILKVPAFFALGAIIFWLVYKDQDIDRIESILKNDVDYFWVWVSLFLGLLSHVSRTIRWGLMIEPLGQKPRLLNTFLAVMVGYLMNMVVPRMGEISRCGVLARYEKISFTKLVGTVVTERLVDVVMMLLLTGLVILTQSGKVIAFFANNPDVRAKLAGINLAPVLIGLLAVAAVAFFVVRRSRKQSVVMAKAREVLQKFSEGLRTIRAIKNKGAFIFHTGFIWFMYYLMMYVVFFAFGFTSGITPLAALTAFVFGSFGMVAPVQGGIGAWHFMVIQALVLYGIDKADGAVFAFLAHSSMTVMMVVMGLVALMILPFINRRNTESL